MMMSSAIRLAFADSITVRGEVVMPGSSSSLAGWDGGEVMLGA